MFACEKRLAPQPAHTEPILAIAEITSDWTCLKLSCCYFDDCILRVAGGEGGPKRAFSTYTKSGKGRLDC